MRRLLSLLFALTLMGGLAACDSAEERAEAYYQSALALLEEGDVERAIVELRNVFRLVPEHPEARLELARVFRDEVKSPQRAYTQYLRFAEQYPDHAGAQIELTELAFLVANWDEMERFGRRALALEPENPRVQIIGAALDYRDAISNEDDAARGQAIVTARMLMETNQSSRILTEMVLDDHLRELEFTPALALIDKLISENPDAKRYQLQRLQVLISTGDQDAIGQQLREIVDRYPDDVDMQRTLVRYYLSRNEMGPAEDFLRELVEAGEGDDPGPRLELIRFLMELRSVDAAREELADAIATEENPAPFVIFKSALDFATGDTEGAISDLEAAIATAQPSEETNNMKVSLAQMLLSTGNEVGARSLVEEVLSEDGSQPEALKLNASWLIESDEIEAAISDLRTVLDINPEDSNAMTLMADAHLRRGSPALARDFLSLAVEASGNAPEETIRYVQYLISEERFLPAEDNLLPALRIAPTDLGLLRTAAQLYYEMDDLGRLQQVIETLRRIETEEADALANALEVKRLQLVSGPERAVAYLEELAASADGADVSRLMLVSARLSVNDLEGAVALAEEIVGDQPDNPALWLMFARTLVGADQPERAAEQLTLILEDFPDQGGLWVELAAMQVRSGNRDQARTTIVSALEQLPDDPSLLWAQASYLEQDGDIEGAIAIYEDLYQTDSNSVILANNLASLLATYREDEESLERAWIIARRFQTSEIPAVQDTYGWIAFRRGDVEDALPYLESAAAQLSDPIVKYHLAEALFALGRSEDALAQYRASLDLVGVADTRPQIEQARARIVEIEGQLDASSD